MKKEVIGKQTLYCGNSLEIMDLLPDKAYGLVLTDPPYMINTKSDGTGKIDPKHLGQMQFQLLVSGRKWCDYVCFNPMFKNPLYVKRIWPDSELQTKISDGLAKGRELIKQYLKEYEEKYL